MIKQCDFPVVVHLLGRNYNSITSSQGVVSKISSRTLRIRKSGLGFDLYSDFHK